MHRRSTLQTRTRSVMGFTLVELMVVLMISSMLAAIAIKQQGEKNLETIAEGAGVQINAVAQAAENHVLMNWEAYEAGNDVAGVANDLQPTIAELIALGRLRAGFPTVTPTRQTLRIDVLRTNCPGTSCQILTTACTTTPVTWGGAGNTRFDLAAIMYEVQGGRGGMSLIGDGSNIRGAGINRPNPVGNVEGIVCGSSYVDVGMFNNFVRLRDARDPDLQGNLTVAGNVSAGGNLSAGGNTTLGNDAADTVTIAGATNAAGNVNVGPAANPCIRLDASGRASFGCGTNPANVPAGYAAGSVVAANMVANTNIVASDNPTAFTGANGNYAVITANNGSGTAEIRTSGRAAGDRLTPLGSYAANAVCAAADEGSIARLSGGTGLVTCTGGRWRVLSMQAAANDLCTTEGATAKDASDVTLFCLNGAYRPITELIRTGTVNGACTTLGATAIDTTSNNEALICRVNLGGGTARWMRLRDVTSHLVFIRADEVAPGQVITKPVCNAHASQVSQAVIQLIPKAWGSPNGGQVFFADDTSATTWTVRMLDGAGNTLLGAPTAVAIAQIYCYFP